VEPESIALLQHAVRGGGAKTFEEYSATVNADSAPLDAARLMRFKTRADGGIPLDEVEPATEIVKRFSTGAWSLDPLARGARDAAVANEPHRWPLEHGRGRRGPCSLR